MTYIPLEQVLPQVSHNVYHLSVLASRRAQELAAGQPKLVETEPGDRIATIALKEIRDGKVIDKQAIEIREALEKAAAKKNK